MGRTTTLFIRQLILVGAFARVHVFYIYISHPVRHMYLYMKKSGGPQQKGILWTAGLSLLALISAVQHNLLCGVHVHWMSNCPISVDIGRVCAVFVQVRTSQIHKTSPISSDIGQFQYDVYCTHFIVILQTPPHVAWRLAIQYRVVYRKTHVLQYSTISVHCMCIRHNNMQIYSTYMYLLPHRQCGCLLGERCI